jgi:hypothetical protein
MAGCIMFKTAPECEEEMRILFDSICVTNATSFVPECNKNASGHAEHENGDDDADVVEKEGEQSDDIPSPAVGKSLAETLSFVSFVISKCCCRLNVLYCCNMT